MRHCHRVDYPLTGSSMARVEPKLRGSSFAKSSAWRGFFPQCGAPRVTGVFYAADRHHGFANPATAPCRTIW